MISEVLGYKPINFKDEASGRQITGYSIFLSEAITTVGGAGVETSKVFLSTWSNPFLGKANVDINLKGKVTNISPLK